MRGEGRAAVLPDGMRADGAALSLRFLPKRAARAGQPTESPPFTKRSAAHYSSRLALRRSRRPNEFATRNSELDRLRPDCIRQYAASLSLCLAQLSKPPPQKYCAPTGPSPGSFVYSRILAALLLRSGRDCFGISM